MNKNTIDAFKRTTLVSAALGRTALYLTEYKTFNFLSGLVPGGKRPLELNGKKLLNVIRADVLELYKKDAENIAGKIYPRKVLATEKVLQHLFRLPTLFFDGISIYLRRGKGKTQTFGKEAKKKLETLPRYFRRNFHFQTDGYLSTKSAEIYDHQVDLLFLGTTDSMRRMLLKPLVEFARKNKKKDLKILEVGCGTGRMSRFLKLALPEAELTVSDLSDAYLKKAQKDLKAFSQINFVCADATNLPFKEESFDVVYSIFLFHELPLVERKKVMNESRRVLKKGGFFGWVDSIQTGDFKAYDESLLRFPKNFHEPFFRNYIENSMENLVSKAFRKKPKTERALFSKLGFVLK